ncbi:MAG TPA: hypothetical protein PLS50_06980, partial [Candidatus Dojkabacteria bacterium]|nr:hypothetical protein [Candidatus Dojkabacteria bacterium]
TSLIDECKKNYQEFLFVQKVLVELSFPWLDIVIKNKVLIANGTLNLLGDSYDVKMMFSPFFDYRFDRIYIKNAGIKFHPAIHVYNDLSLCLYHPTIDMPLLRTIPLVDMVSWIPEWCVHFREWKKYGVWLGKEIKH